MQEKKHSEAEHGSGEEKSRRTQGRILTIGPDLPVNRFLAENLQPAADAAGMECVPLSSVEAVQPNDCVLLTGGRTWQELDEVLRCLQKLEQTHPCAVLLISDVLVYGKLFGVPHLLREQEIGYVSHTGAKDMAAQCLRTAEHLCCRMAREGKLPVRIVRADWAQILSQEAEGRVDSPAVPEENGRIAEELVRVLLCGTDGEAYNLALPDQMNKNALNENSAAALGQSPAEKAAAGWQSVNRPGFPMHSPLSPVAVLVDDAKLQALAK